MIVREPHHTTDRRGDLCVFKIQFGLFHRCFVSFDVCSARLGGGDGCIALLVANHFLLKQIQRAFLVRVCFCLVSFILCQSTLGLRQRGFERSRIDLKKEVAFFYDTAFRVIERNDVALYLCVDVSVDEAIQCRHALQHTWHIVRRDCCNEYFRRIRSCLRRFTRASRRDCSDDQQRGRCRDSEQSLITHGIDMRAAKADASNSSCIYVHELGYLMIFDDTRAATVDGIDLYADNRQLFMNASRSALIVSARVVCLLFRGLG